MAKKQSKEPWWDVLIKTPAAREYHEATKWALNGNVPGLYALHRAEIERLNGG
jgi:hypothetical protein